MSAYSNFVNGFASRSLELFDELKGDAEAIELEVTFLISIATSSFVMTYERMKNKNPSSDYITFPQTKRNLDNELNTSIKDSSLFNEGWKFLEVSRIQGDPDSWLKEEDAVNIAEKNTNDIIDILRNALTHGSIWTKGKKINMLIFVSRKDFNKHLGPFNVLCCSPQTFKDFVENWVKLLNKP